MKPTEFLPIAVRAWTDGPRDRHGKASEIPDTGHILVIDTETTIDPSQALTFGFYRYCRVDGLKVTTVAEGIFHSDDLSDSDPNGYRVLQEYAATHSSDVDHAYLGCEPDPQLGLMPRSVFLRRWVRPMATEKRNGVEPATIVMFNSPFDISRLAVDVGESRGQTFGGGFSFTWWLHDDGNANGYRPRVRVKSIDSKRSMKGFTGTAERKAIHRGHFLDLRTLVFALTGRSHSLASACVAFTVENGKATTEEHGTITTTYVDYARQDVKATTELYARAIEEYQRHPIKRQITKAFSPASIAKSYLHAMGVRPVLDRMPDFPADVLGFAMSAFYGGRAECHIRKVPLPVVVCDFTSMYPTVDALMGLWEILTAAKVATVDATDDVHRLVSTITLDACFNPDMWKEFVGIVQVRPSGDVLPVRATYGATDQYNIGINPLHSREPLWYTIPDIVASALLTGKAPEIVRAIRFEAAGGQLKSLRNVALRGQIDIDPRRVDFFRTVVEQRQAVKRDDPKLADFLKVLANAGSYGIFAEVIRASDEGKTTDVTVYGAAPNPWTSKTNRPETPGEFCFPPIAACITGAARLMLAMLERSVTDAGGTWVFADTDSMAIVANTDGGEMKCGPSTIKALTLRDVENIRHRFATLNPYDRETVSDILKEERSGLCYAISSKRYALFHVDDTGRVVIDKNSEHGLGHLMNPTNAGSDDRNYVRQIWHAIISEAIGAPYKKPEWLDLPALSRISISTPRLLDPFENWNAGKRYAEQVKPFNFMTVATTAGGGDGLANGNTERFRLVAPYNTDVRGWRRYDWRNLYQPETEMPPIVLDHEVNYLDEGNVNTDKVVISTYDSTLKSYRMHPEPTHSDPKTGDKCSNLTIGELARRTVRVATIKHIGKEANRVGDFESGPLGELEKHLTDYTNEDDALTKLVIPTLANIPADQLAETLGCNTRTIQRIRKGTQNPSSELRTKLIREAIETALHKLDNSAATHRWNNSETATREWPRLLAFNLEHSPEQRTCRCGCNATVTGKQVYHSATCRKRASRA